jgi:uncharacterized protein
MYLIARDGDGMHIDRKKAVEYLQRSADKGYPASMSDLGSRLLSGSGIVEDKKRAAKYLEAAVEAGEMEANIDLGKYYITERGLVKRGLEVVHRAESTWRGKVALLYYYGDGVDGVPRNPSIAIRILEEMIAASSAPSIAIGPLRFDLAEYYYYGYGSEPDPHKAAMVLEPVIDSSPDAKDFYAWLLFRGEGVTKDQDRAVRMWLGNGRPGEIYGYRSNGLALAYATGAGVKKDSEKARGLFKGGDFGSAGYWHMYFTTMGLTGAECSTLEWHLRQRNGTVKGTRYERIAAKAFVAYAECLTVLAKKESNARMRSDYLRYADAFLKDSYTLGTSVPDSLREKILALKREDGVTIGMTTEQVLASKWGKPREINRTQTADGVSEQWMYGGRNYLYFRNGVLETIQN